MDCSKVSYSVRQSVEKINVVRNLRVQYGLHIYTNKYYNNNIIIIIIIILLLLLPVCINNNNNNNNNNIIITIIIIMTAELGYCFKCVTQLNKVDKC